MSCFICMKQHIFLSTLQRKRTSTPTFPSVSRLPATLHPVSGATTFPVSRLTTFTCAAHPQVWLCVPARTILAVYMSQVDQSWQVKHWGLYWTRNNVSNFKTFQFLQNNSVYSNQTHLKSALVQVKFVILIWVIIKVECQWAVMGSRDGHQTLHLLSYNSILLTA